jgi:hypothetical protein
MPFWLPMDKALVVQNPPLSPPSRRPRRALCPEKALGMCGSVCVVHAPLCGHSKTTTDHTVDNVGSLVPSVLLLLLLLLVVCIDASNQLFSIVHSSHPSRISLAGVHVTVAISTDHHQPPTPPPKKGQEGTQNTCVEDLQPQQQHKAATSWAKPRHHHHHHHHHPPPPPPRRNVLVIIPLLARVAIVQNDPVEVTNGILSHNNGVARDITKRVDRDKRVP